jgi:nitroreductase
MGTRQADFPVEPLFLERWSPRAFDAEPITEAALMTVLEAARWAPSAFNIQPWRFIYARREEPGWEELLSLLIPFNQSWAARASALIFVASERTAPSTSGGSPTPSYSHSFDAGAAWACLSLQATLMGLFAHAMTGFDVQRAYKVLSVPSSMRLEAAIALGKIGDKSALPEALQAREQLSSRKPLKELVSKARYTSGGEGGIRILSTGLVDPGIA